MGAFDRIADRATSSTLDVNAYRQNLLVTMSSHPWEFLKALDYDGTPIVHTKDEKDIDSPYKPYPFDREYLKHMVFQLMDPGNTIFVMPKSRQIMASYTALLVMFWRIQCLPSQNILVSRIKKDTSVKLIKDKIRDTHIMLPPWLKEAWPLTAEPKDVITAPKTGGTIQAVPQTFANAETRGDAASVIVVDEAAFQDNLPKIMTASLAMAQQIVLISSPTRTGEGSEVMQAYIKKAKDNNPSVLTPHPGLIITKSKIEGSDKGICVFEINYKTYEQQNKSWLYLNEGARRQEQELSWESTEGRPYFPEAAMYGGNDFYHRDCTTLDPNLPIDRGFDFGVTRPACVWSQTDETLHRIIIAKDLLGVNIDPHSFGALVRYLSGEISYAEMAEHKPAILALDDLNSKGIDTNPWFAPGFTFRNWGGHEANRAIATGAGQKLQTFAEIFASINIPMTPRWVPKERREYILRQLLKPRKDGAPSIIIDKYGAPIVMNGILYGLVRPSTKAIHAVEEPVADNYYKDVYDALGYTLIGTLSHVNWETIEHPEPPRREDIDLNKFARMGYKRWSPEVENVSMVEALATRW
jgi:hypothetical protein